MIVNYCCVCGKIVELFDTIAVTVDEIESRSEDSELNIEEFSSLG